MGRMEEQLKIESGKLKMKSEKSETSEKSEKSYEDSMQEGCPK